MNELVEWVLTVAEGLPRIALSDAQLCSHVIHPSRETQPVPKTPLLLHRAGRGAHYNQSRCVHFWTVPIVNLCQFIHFSSLQFHAKRPSCTLHVNLPVPFVATPSNLHSTHSTLLPNFDTKFKIIFGNLHLFILLAAQKHSTLQILTASFGQIHMRNLWRHFSL